MNNKNNFSHIFKMFITPRASQKLDLTQNQSSILGWFACGSVNQCFEIDAGAYSQLDAPRNGLKA